MEQHEKHCNLLYCAAVVTNLFLPESLNPLANGLRSIFSLVICRKEGDFCDYCSLSLFKNT